MVYVAQVSFLSKMIAYLGLPYDMATYHWYREGDDIYMIYYWEL